MKPDIKNVQQIYAIRDITGISPSRHISEYKVGKSPKQIIWNAIKTKARTEYVKNKYIYGKYIKNDFEFNSSDYEIEITAANKRYVSISVFVKRKDSTKYIISKFTVWPWGNQSTKYSPRFR